MPIFSSLCELLQWSVVVHPSVRLSVRRSKISQKRLHISGSNFVWVIVLLVDVNANGLVKPPTLTYIWGGGAKMLFWTLSTSGPKLLRVRLWNFARIFSNRSSLQIVHIMSELFKMAAHRDFEDCPVHHYRVWALSDCLMGQCPIWHISPGSTPLHAVCTFCNREIYELFLSLYAWVT